MKQVCILLALSCLFWHAGAQVSLRGTVAGTGSETLIGAHVTLNNNFQQTITDETGSFALKVKAGKYRLSISYVGYNPHDEVIIVRGDTVIKIQLRESTIVSDAVIISAVRAGQNTPTTYSTVNKDEISRSNIAQDLPYILGMEPSVVTTSDAGAGVGYTGMRIRGSDITRINVTINGIPLNDAESHAVYWVDIPDFASSVQSLQLQRGVGSSTNGAGAFGASMNIETNTFQPEPFALLSLGAGSFDTWKTSFQAGTGLIKDHWYFEGRGSRLGSDGYIDRASSDLSAYFLQGGYYDKKTLIKAVAFGGKERTYQAWWGVDEYTMNQRRTFNWAGVISNEDSTMSYYDNQTDNYNQHHYQLHLSHRLTDLLKLNISGHYTTGSGYYEEYQQGEAFIDYGLNNLLMSRDSIFNGTGYDYFYNDTITTSDLIRRRWLDNRYYGATWSLQRKTSKTDFVIGGAWNKYDRAKHYGEVIWAAYAQEIPSDYEYYHNTSFKTDFNLFAKLAWSPWEALTIYGDLQYRRINYSGRGIESHLEPVVINESFNFFNPKAGISYQLPFGMLYASYSIAHREPIRDDYIDAQEGETPKPESLGNLEIGIRKSDRQLQYSLNYYLMNYKDQLVLTGEINDDGAFIRRNAGKSYRTGVELAAGYKPVRLVEIDGSLSLSLNKTDYRQPDDEGQMIEYKNTTISFSPSVVGSGQISFFPIKNLEVSWLMKYVGKQYLDNTENKLLALDPYLINDARVAYVISEKGFPAVEMNLMINNVFNNLYESNGYVYNGSPGYYPQAGIHFMAGLNIRW
jgi:iron complex outermembrane receptor protein